MQLMILSRRVLENIGDNIAKKHIVISIAGTAEAKYINLALKPNNNRLDTLQLLFDDIDDSIDHTKYGFVLFDTNMAQKIIDFVQKYKDNVELIVCQCEAGISRSAAVAVALTYYFNDAEARKKIYKLFSPNAFVVDKILEVFKHKGLGVEIDKNRQNITNHIAAPSI